MKTGLLEETYELIKSLSKTEKRYFKLYTRFQQGDKSYLNLFDILDRQTLYDEKKINNKFVAKNKVTNFPAVKKYLFDQLIASIKSYGAYKDLDSDHTDLIETYKVLHYKGLHRQSQKLLKKIKSVTLLDDAFIRHFYVLLMEYMSEMFNPDDSDVERIYRVLEEKKHILNIIQNYTEVGDLFSYQRLYLRKKMYCRTNKEKEELKKLMAPVLKTKETDMLSRTALALRSMGLCDYYTAIGQPHKAVEVSKVHLELRQNSGDKIDTTTISEYLQHLTLCIRSGIYEGFEENLKKFRTILDTIRNRQKFMMGFERWYNLSFIYYNRRGEFAKAIGFTENEKATMARIADDLSMKSKITLWYFTAYNNYARKEFQAALKMIQKILNASDNSMEEFNYAKLLMMFIHYDLKNYELLEYQVRSYRRLMQKTERQYKSEMLIIDFFNSLSGSDNKKLRLEQLKELQKKVSLLYRTYYERGLLFYFDFNSWIEAQLSGNDFAEEVSRANNTVDKKH